MLEVSHDWVCEVQAGSHVVAHVASVIRWEGHMDADSDVTNVGSQIKRQHQSHHDSARFQQVLLLPRRSTVSRRLLLLEPHLNLCIGHPTRIVSKM